jgi:hypothetical protein
MDREGAATVRYITQDPIQNLRIRVTLTRLSALTRGKGGRPDGKQQQEDRQQHDRSTDAANAPDNAVAAAAEPAVEPAAEPPRLRAARATRVFGWQEKVYSQAELAAARLELRAGQRQQRAAASARAEHFGSQGHCNAGGALSGTQPPEGSPLFTYVHTDPFCEAAETAKAVTTSGSEGGNHLVRRLLRQPRSRQKVRADRGRGSCFRSAAHPNCGHPTSTPYKTTMTSHITHSTPHANSTPRCSTTESCT